MGTVFLQRLAEAVSSALHPYLTISQAKHEMADVVAPVLSTVEKGQPELLTGLSGMAAQRKEYSELTAENYARDIAIPV